ncbi:DUF3352 domain-containing protein [Argonema galeatum]|uniref:DUF3352 domain-containing protein n=1 Tax=Argonema galeatum TaxID=2942762 RepID=UPI0020127E6D|nr:DUF3352 domain-containing protein [Argonema galeatum]MCL1464821.1 DUF3352 domain-containing protein [Argonema galeatum A003/A1]
MIKGKKPSLLLTLGTTALLIGGGATAYWVLSQRAQLSGILPAGANVVPQDALVALSVSTNPDRWQQLHEFGTKESQAGFDRTLSNLRDRFLAPNGYNYQQDIQSWAGKEVTIAFLSQQTKSPEGKLTQQPSKPEPDKQSVVIVLPIDDPVRAIKLLEQPNSPLKQGNWVDRTYKGVQIKEIKVRSTENYSATVLDRRFLVITTDSKATDRAIDTYLGGASLATTPGYSQALEQIKADRPFAKLYVNIPAAASVAKNFQQQVSPQGFVELQQQQGLATTITLEKEGIRFKSISWLKPNSQKKYAVKNEAGIMPKLLPADTLMMMSGGNLKQFWQEYVQGAESNPITPFKPQELRNLVKNFSNLDLDRDLVAWMGGEFSLCLIPFPQQSSSDSPSLNSGAGVVFMVKASDRSLAEKSLQQFDRALANKYNLKVETTKIGDLPVINFTSPSQGQKMSHGWLKDNVAFLVLGDNITDAIVPQPKATLASSQLFQNIVPLELKPNNGNFFLDIDRLGIDLTASVLTSLFRLSPDPNTQRMLRNSILPTQAVGITTAISDARSTRFDIFVKLKKVEK